MNRKVSYLSKEARALLSYGKEYTCAVDTRNELLRSEGFAIPTPVQSYLLNIGRE